MESNCRDRTHVRMVRCGSDGKSWKEPVSAARSSGTVRCMSAQGEHARTLGRATTRWRAGRLSQATAARPPLNATSHRVVALPLR